MYYNWTSYFGRRRYHTLVILPSCCYVLSRSNIIISKCWLSQFLFIALLLLLCKSYLLLSRFKHNHYIHFPILLNFSLVQFHMSLSLLLFTFSNCIRFSARQVGYLSVSFSSELLAPVPAGTGASRTASVLRLPAASPVTDSFFPDSGVLCFFGSSLILVEHIL